MSAVRETLGPQRPAGLNPAIGAGDALPRRVRLRRGAVVLTLILLLGLAKILISTGIIQVSSPRPAVQAVVPGLFIGGTPGDADLQNLADGYRVDAVVNLDAPSVAERATTASLHQAYLYLPLSPGTSPTSTQLRTLASFMRRYTARGSWVYLHDDAGGGRAVTTAAMLLLLRGETWSAASAEITTADLESLSDGQRLAVKRLEDALHPAGQHPAGTSGATVRLDPW
jgi:hypothetical protein